MLYFQKFFKIPGPADLGMSKYNGAMPSELFNDPEDGATWEQYYARIKKEYPVKYFFSYSVPNTFSDCWRKISTPVKDGIYWLKCHLLPSYKFHLLDLRTKEYRYGWMDRSEGIVLANFAMLVSYVEKELDGISGIDEMIKFHQEEVENDSVNQNSWSWLKHYQEIKYLYHYWTVDRLAQEERKSNLLDLWCESKKKSGRSEETNRLWNLMQEADEKFDQEETDALIMLVKTRKGMWT